jgi:hypothetical protein
MLWNGPPYCQAALFFIGSEVPLLAQHPNKINTSKETPSKHSNRPMRQNHHSPATSHQPPETSNQKPPWT